MSSRPRRSAAQKASVAITDIADRDNMSSSRSRRSGDGKGSASVSRSGQGDKDHTYLTVKMPSSKLRQATTNKQGSSISVNNESTSKRPTRGNKKSYVVDDSDSDGEEDEGEDEIQVGAPAADVDEDEDDEMDDADADADADGEIMDDEMDIDAEGEDEEDAEGEDDVDMSPIQPAPVIKISKPTKASPSSKKTKQATPKKTAGQPATHSADDSDDDELSDLNSDDDAMNVGDEDAEGEEDDEDVDAEGEEIEDDQDAEGEAEVDPDAEGDPDPEEMDSDDDASRGETPDLSRMTIRQRARFEGLDESHYQALSNEVQAKKVFTVEEKAMRRAEMARRRRNLSEKRNEEVKQETINKLLKKQAGKTNRKGLGAIGEGDDEEDGRKPNAVFVRWISSREGNRVGVPEEILYGPTGRVFANATRPGAALGGPRKLIQDVTVEEGNKENQ